MLVIVVVKISRLRVHRFTAFEDAKFDFAAGVNVLIGENGTGKSHVLKLLYAVSEAVRRHATGEGLDGLTGPRGLDEILAAMLASVFLPDELGRLVRRAKGRRTAEAQLTWDTGTVELKLSSLGKVTAKLTGDVSGLERGVFLPTREVLSIFPGFVETWLRRESTFDRTYYDLCLALGLPPLRGPRDATRAALLKPIEEALRASVVVDHGRFYLRYDDGNMEAPLVAEGHRKLAMVAYLIINGSLTSKGFLFWDEPEASMNPKLSRLTRDVVFGMGKLGVQSFITTHDYVLASELSLAAGAVAAGAEVSRFFALGRESGKEGVGVEVGAVLNDLETNPILDAFVDLNGRERAAMMAREES